MRQSKNTKRSLTYIELSIRVFIFSIFLMGNVCILISTATSNPIFAQGIVRNVSRQHFMAQKPLTVVSTQNKEHSKAQTGHRSAPSHSIAPQDLSVAATVEGGPSFQVGQTLTFDMNITNISSTTTLNSTSGVTGFGVIPLGLSNITVAGSGWAATTSNSISPATIVASYTGSPVGPGAAFAPIVVTGTLNSNAVPVFASTLGASDNSSPNTALATFSVNVSPAAQTPTATPSATATATATPITNSELGVSLNIHGGPTFQVGQTLTVDVDITNITSTTTLDSTSGVRVGNLVPLGLSNIVTTGSDWTVTSTAANGPFLIIAAYSGPPVAPGGAFPPFEISGTLNPNASPVYTNRAGVADTHDPNYTIISSNVNVSPATQTPTATPTTDSELGISLNVHGGPTFQVGQTLTVDVNVTNVSSTTTLDSTSNLTVANLVPPGLSNIVTTGSDWTVIATAANSPILIEAVYSGPPVAPGGTFPPFEISGTLNPNASPVYTNRAGVGDTHDPAGVTTSFTLNVSPATQTPTATPTTNSELGVSLNVHGGPTFQVGQTLTYDVNVTNITSTTTLDSTSGVTVGSGVPLGLSNIVTTGSDWTIIATAANGPILILASYSGPPVAPGGAFPPFEISGTLNPNASPVYRGGEAASDTHDTTVAVTNFSLNVSPAPTATPSPSPTVTSTPTPTVTSTPSPSPTVTSTPTPTVIKPQLYITNSNTGGNIYHVGQTVNYNLVVTNLPLSLAENQPITVYDVLPVGLNNIVASASSDWTISTSSTTSPTMITAQYHGLYPVAAGSILPSISISGDLTEAAVPSFTSNATVHSADDPNPSLNTSINTIVVLESIPTATPTPAPTPEARLSIVNTTTNGDHFEVGAKVNYVVVVSSDPSGGPITTPGSFSVSYVMPLGMSEIEVKGDHWRFSGNDHTSPVLMTAQYTGSYPIKPDTSLPAITITGKLNKNAVPSFTTTAIVDYSAIGNTGTDNSNIASYTVFVQKDGNNHHHNGNGNNDQKNHHGNGNNDGSSSSGSGSNGSHSGSNNTNSDNNRSGSNNGDNHNTNSDSNRSGNSITPGLPATGDSPIASEFLDLLVLA